jgi:MtN3 and saliva related transmembrane protein
MSQEIIKNVFSWVAVVLTATQFIPQAIKSFRTRSTKDLSWWTFAQTVVISLLWIFFGYWRHAPEIIAANVIVNISCLVILAQKYFTERPKADIPTLISSPVRKIIVIFAAALAIFVVAAIIAPPLRDILGWITVALNITQLMPQAVKSFRTKTTGDLSWWTFVQIFTITILWTPYGIWNGLLEVVVTNALVGVICAAILVRKYLSEKNTANTLGQKSAE